MKGFLYRKGSLDRIPYWVTKEQAEALAQAHGGTIDAFSMKLPGYGIMEAARWEFREAFQQDIDDRTQWKIS